MVRRTRARLVFGVAVMAVLAVAPQGSIAAHPLGNFSVSHLNTLTVTPDRLIDDVVIDMAEIPTAQARSEVDIDGDGDASPAELGDYASNECAAVLAAVAGSADGRPLAFAITDSAFAYEPGQAGLDTSRLECRFEGEFDSAAGVPARIEFSEQYRPGRVGWHEINAVGDGVGFLNVPVPETSVTDGLRAYPEELLQSPLDVRDVALDVTAEAGAVATVGDEPVDNAADARDSLVASRPGVFGGFVDGVQNTFDDMIGRDDLTLGVGLLAIGLALILGASHAVLPGHGKTVMAAYIAGRQGSARDAVLVGATVTATHTGGVLLLGLGLTVSTALAGETVLGWLGVISGLIIAGLGLALLVNAARRRESALFGHGHTHGPGGHTHGPVGHRHEVQAVHEHHGDTLVAVDQRNNDHAHHEHGHEHEHHEHEHHEHEHDHDHHGHHDHDPHDAGRVSRSGLVGMGVAGGLVPSPSALIVLLSAIALGRTWFGVVLVIAYGAGMAIVLTLAGIALVSVRDRYQERMESADGKVATSLRRWGRAAPYFTAALVLVVGLGLAIRSVAAL